MLSKMQILILFDFLADTGSLEQINYSKPNKFEAVAEMLQGVTGKSKDSWVEELNNYKCKGLYNYRDEGEMKQLIITLTNLSDILRRSGFRTITKELDIKIMQLEKGK